MGTVQLGLPYGINNKVGKPDEVVAHQILDKAASERIHLLDSAEAYGEALGVIGAYLKQHKSAPFDLVSKFIGDDEPLESKVDRTLSLTGKSNLYAYLFHRFSDYQSTKYRRQLLSLKASGKVQRIGISVYSAEELATSIYDPEIAVIQIPLNPFDASPHKSDLLAEAKALGKEIHVRSVFLQGLLFKQADDLTGNLKGFSGPLRQLGKIAEIYNLSIREICLNFALHQNTIDYVIIGVETVEQLEQNISSVLEHFPASLFTDLRSLPNVGEPLLNPSSWKP